MTSFLYHYDVILTFLHHFDVILTSFSRQMIGPIMYLLVSTDGSCRNLFFKMIISTLEHLCIMPRSKGILKWSSVWLSMELLWKLKPNLGGIAKQNFVWRYRGQGVIKGSSKFKNLGQSNLRKIVFSISLFILIPNIAEIFLFFTFQIRIHTEFILKN